MNRKKLTEIIAKPKEAIVALVYTAVMLTVMEYFFLPPRVEGWWSGNTQSTWVMPTLIAGVIWSIACIVGFFLLPWLFIKIISKSDLKRHGLNFLGFASHLKVYLGLFLLMTPLIYLASQHSDFRGTYPFVPEARNSMTNFLIWELSYVLQFFALEAFFRGYLLFTLERHMDRWLAIAVMIVPYVMIHFHKPIFETLGATVAGLVLGHFALKYRSWVGGAVLHSLVAVSLDSLATFR